MGMLRTLFSLKGRTGRLHYFLHGLADLAVFGLCLAALAAFPKDGVAGVVFPIILLAGAVSEICVTVRRFHDIDHSGLYWLTLLIPLYNIYLGLVLLFERGTDGPNRFGDGPGSTMTGHQAVAGDR